MLGILLTNSGLARSIQNTGKEEVSDEGGWVVDLGYYGRPGKAGFDVWMNGKGKVPTRKSGESTGIHFNCHLAESQVAQELPRGDYAYWEKSLFFPETSIERQERASREAIRKFSGPKTSHSTAYARLWALGRFIFRAGKLQNAQNSSESPENSR